MYQSSRDLDVHILMLRPNMPTHILYSRKQYVKRTVCPKPQYSWNISRKVTVPPWFWNAHQWISFHPSLPRRPQERIHHNRTWRTAAQNVSIQKPKTVPCVKNCICWTTRVNCWIECVKTLDSNNHKSFAKKNALICRNFDYKRVKKPTNISNYLLLWQIAT